MRILTAVVCVAVAGLGVFAAEMSPELKAEVDALKKHVSIGSVVQSNYRDDKDEKIEVFKAVTEQDKDSTFMGIMRFTFEVTDKNGDVYFGQVSLKQRASPTTDESYTGEHTWEFKVPHGQLKYPKFNAYAMEFGIETNKTIIPVVAQLKKVESGDEITARNKDPKKKLKLKPGRTVPVRVNIE